MSNLFQRQLSQGDQVNLQSPLAIASLSSQTNQFKPFVQGFSPTHRPQNSNIQTQNHHQLTSITNASSEQSLMDSTQGQGNTYIKGVSPFTLNHKQTPQAHNMLNKENNSPIFYRPQPQYSEYQVPSGQNENNFNPKNEYINPTKLFTQEFINQNKQKFQASPKVPLQPQHQYNSIQNMMGHPQQQNLKEYESQKVISARNDYINNLKNPTQYYQQQQQHLMNHSGFGVNPRDNLTDFSSNQTLFDQSQIPQNNGYYFSGMPTPNSLQSSSNNNSNVYFNPTDQQNALNNINFKMDQAERPLSMLLENAINRAITQSDRVVSTPPPTQYAQMSQLQRQPYVTSTPEILIEDFSNQVQNYIVPSNNTQLNNGMSQRSPSHHSGYSSHRPQQNSYHNSNNISNLSINNGTNNILNNSYLPDNGMFDNRNMHSPMLSKQQSAASYNNTAMSPLNNSHINNNSYYNNQQNNQNQRDRNNQPRLTLVERQTLNSTSHSPSKSTHHINCKYPNGEHTKCEPNQQSSKKKSVNYAQIHGAQTNQAPSLTRSKSNNSIITQHPFLKKNTRNNRSPTQNSAMNTSNSISKGTNRNSKISTLDRAATQRSLHKTEANDMSSTSIKLDSSNLSHRRAASPNINALKNSTTPKNMKQQNSLSKNKQNNEFQNGFQDNNQFIFHQQQVSSLNPAQEFYEDQYNQVQQQQGYYTMPHSVSSTNLAQMQNGNPQYLQQQQQQFPRSNSKFNNQHQDIQFSNLQQFNSPKTPMNTNQSQMNNNNTSSILPIEAMQMEQIITNVDVQRFLYRHFLVGESSQQLICENWHSIPIIFFIKLLITEFPEVLEDHQIGEALLTELKEKITILVQDEENHDFINLFKLQTYTKTTGLLGLILKALKELSSEEHSKLYSGNAPSMLQRTNSDLQIAQQLNLQNQSVQSQQQLSSFVSNNQFFENFKTVFQNSLEKNSVQYQLQSKDVQNVMNIIQEFVEGLYRDMENEIYSKFNIEMRRMMVKFKETEQMLKIVSDKVTDNYGLFSQEASQIKKIRQLQTEKSELNDQIYSKDLEIKKLTLLVDSLKIENTKLLTENDKLHEKCEKYLDFGMKNVQTFYENNLQDQYQQLVQQQKTFFEQQIKQLEEYKMRQSLCKRDQQNALSNNKNHPSNTKQSPHLITDGSDAESCNLSYALMTLEDQSVPQGGFQSSSKIPQQAIKALTQFETHQNQNAFKKNKTEGQTLEPVMMDNTQFFDTSDKVSLLKVLDTFISQCQIKDFVQQKKNQNLSYGQGLPGFTFSNQGSFVVNTATITGRLGYQGGSENVSTQASLNLDQAVDKLKSLIEILPLIREVRLFNYEQISNFLKYMYSLQMYIYQQVDYRTKEQGSNNQAEEDLNKNGNQFHITSIPMNKCWKKILSEQNNKDFFCSFIEQNNNNNSDSIQSQTNGLSTPTCARKSHLKPSASSSSLTPTSKPDILKLQKLGHEQLQQKGNETQTNCHSNENRFNPGYLIINNQGIIDILIYVLNQHLQKIISCERQQQSSEAKSKYFLLKMLIYLNILIISNNKNDISNVLTKFFSEIQSQLHYQHISDFIRDNNVLNVVFLSLRNINFANTQIVADALQFLVSFKQASSNYMSFIRQLSNETNMTVLLQLLECQFDTRNIMMALNLIKNVSYSINFKENIQSRIRQVLDAIQSRSSDNQEKELEDITKVIRSNISCGVNIRTISLNPSQTNINGGSLCKQQY